MTLGFIHSFETFGSVDGPGVRFVVFMQGCPLRCLYCHNPDTWKTSAGTSYESSDVVRRALRYRSYWGEDGGVTVSGGEPLLQIDFVTDLFKDLKKEGVHTCIDTSGATFRSHAQYLKKFDTLMEYTDLVLLDLKQIVSEKHKKLTSVPNEHILDCARHLDDIHKEMWIRHVLLPSYTDNEADLRGLRAFIDTLSSVKKVEVLPYHTLGIHKYESLHLDYALKDIEPPSVQSLTFAKEILEFQKP